MIMADVFAAFGTLLALGIALPGLLLTWQLLLPNVVQRAEQRLEANPWRCFWAGLVLLGLALIPLAILFNIPGPGQALGFATTFLLMTVASLGAAGLARLMGQRLQKEGVSVSISGATIRGAVAMALAAIFPVIGWFIFIPLTLIITFGAAMPALWPWRSRAKVAEANPEATQPDDLPALYEGV